MKRTYKFIFISILLFSATNICIYTSPFSFFTGGSDKEKDDRNKKASELLTELINDGTLTQLEDNNTFIELVGQIADNILLIIYTNITPNIKNLTYSNKSSSDIFSNTDTEAIKSSSFIGNLITIFLCLECLILGIKNLIDSNGISLVNIISKFLHIAFLLVFFLYLPTIVKTVINIFTYMAQIASKGLVNEPTNNNKLFYYMPSDVLQSLSFCKDILSIEKIRLGGYSIPTIIPHLTINLGELIVSIPFLYLLITIVFWYVELFLILLAAYIILPFCIFSFVELSSISLIIKSIILQGLKIFSGIFLANTTSTIIISVVQNLDGSLTSVGNTILFCIFMSIILFFILTKGPGIVLSIVTGENKAHSNSAFSGAMGAVAGALSNHYITSKKSAPTIPPFSPIPAQNISNKNTTSKDTNQNSDNNSKNNDKIEKLNNNNTSSKGIKYGEVSARPSLTRMKAARTELENEGFSNISDTMVKDRATRDAKIEKLVKMEKKGFLTEDGIFNRPAFLQLQRIRNGEE